MPAWRLNDVPICMYLATHFYFSSYHVFANLALRRVATGFAPGNLRTALFAYVVCGPGGAVCARFGLRLLTHSSCGAGLRPLVRHRLHGDAHDLALSVLRL